MTIYMDSAQVLLTCLRTALEARPNVPGVICLRAGEQVAPLLGTSTDECCTGLAWVRVAQVDARLDPDDPLNECLTSLRRTTLEMGVARCMPWGTVGAPPTCDQWTQVALQLDNDHGAMEEALCCAFDEVSALLADEALLRPGTYAPFGPDGNCIGGTMQVLIDTDCGVC